MSLPPPDTVPDGAPSADVRGLRQDWHPPGWTPDAVLPRVRALLVLGIIAATLVVAWVDAARTNLIPCARDCGEILVALQYVDNFRLYGLQYGVVEDMATSSDPSAHPYLYTHNVNFAGLYFTLLDMLGARPFWAKQLVTALGFGIGLAYVYRATALISRSWLAGLATLLFFVTDVGQVLPFALNALRTWHWLALFGLLFHLNRMVRARPSSRVVDRVGAALCAALAFGVGYDFWIICGFLAGAIVLLCQPHPRAFGRASRQLAYVAVIFAVPFVVRQIQIIAVLGPAFWFRDVVYSAAIKVSVLSLLVPVPPQPELDAIYRAAGVVRAPAQPTASWAAIWGTFREMTYHLLLPDVGLIALVLTGVAVLGSAAVVCGIVLCRPRQIVGLCRRARINSQARRQLVGASLLVAIVMFAVVAGLAFFAPLSLHIYLKHRFPLVIAPILLVKGLMVAALVSWFAHARARRPRLAWGALLAATLLVADHGMVQVRTARATESMSLAWIDAVAERRESSFVVSYVANAVTAYSDGWAVGLPAGREREIAARIQDGRLPFKLDEYLLFGLRDAATRGEEYRRPDFWLYFPTEQLAPFDSPAPTCRQDYLLRAFQRVRLGADPVPRLRDEFWIQRSVVRPGDMVRIGGLIEYFGDTTFRAELLMDGEPVGPLNFDCLRGRFLGEYRVPDRTTLGEHVFAARLISPSGEIYPMGEAAVSVDPTAPPAAPFLSGAQPAQPSPDELEALMPGVPVATRGPGYVIFDLRSEYERLR